MKIDLTVDGVADARDLLTSMGDRAVNARPMLDDVADLLFQANRRLWATGGFGRWPASEAHPVDPRVMFESGRLQAALTIRGRDAAAVQIGRDDVFVGIPAGRSGIGYGRYHHLGRGVPQRAIVVEARAVQRDVEARVQSWIAAGR